MLAGIRRCAAHRSLPFITAAADEMLLLLRRTLSHGGIAARRKTAGDPSSSSTDDASSLAVHFLVKSCGLSRAAAMAAASKLGLMRSTRNPHAVISLLRSYGFSDEHVASLVSRQPNLLLSDPEKTLRPKIEFLRSSFPGISDLAGFLSTYPYILLWSVDRRLAPNLELLRSIFPDDDVGLTAAVRSSGKLLVTNLPEVLAPQIGMLERHGVPIQAVLKIIPARPRCLMERPGEFVEAFDAAAAAGISRSSPAFVRAIRVLSRLPEGEWERRLAALAGRGWTREEAVRAFVRQPYVMSAPEGELRRRMEFLEVELGWGREFVAGNLAVLQLSLEKRVVPRCAVVEILLAAEVPVAAPPRWLLIGEEEFMERYVRRYQGEVPQVADAIRGKIKLGGFEVLKKRFQLS